MSRQRRRPGRGGGAARARSRSQVGARSRAAGRGRTGARFAGRGRVTLLAIVVLTVVLGAANGFTASNTVAGSSLGHISQVIDAAALAPAICTQNGIVPTTVIVGSGVVNGTSGSDLIIGSSSADTLNGGGGNDCLVAGGTPSGQVDLLLPHVLSSSVCIGGTGLGTTTFGAACLVRG